MKKSASALISVGASGLHRLGLGHEELFGDAERYGLEPKSAACLQNSRPLKLVRKHPKTIMYGGNTRDGFCYGLILLMFLVCHALAVPITFRCVGTKDIFKPVNYIYVYIYPTACCTNLGPKRRSLKQQFW